MANQKYVETPLPGIRERNSLAIEEVDGQPYIVTDWVGSSPAEQKQLYLWAARDRYWLLGEVDRLSAENQYLANAVLRLQTTPERLP